MMESKKEMIILMMIVILSPYRGVNNNTAREWIGVERLLYFSCDDNLLLTI